MINWHKKMELVFQELCEILRPKLPYSDKSMEYVQVREYGLALEFIRDWCIDAEPQINLTTRELLKIKEVADLVNKKGAWIELLPLLIDSETIIFPLNQPKIVEDYIENQVINNPIREIWLSKIRTTMEKIKNHNNRL